MFYEIQSSFLLLGHSTFPQNPKRGWRNKQIVALSLNGEKLVSEQYCLCCPTIRCGIKVRITLGTAMLLPFDSLRFFAPNGRSSTK